MTTILALCSRYAVISFGFFFACFATLIYKQKLMPIKNIGNAKNSRLTILVAVTKKTTQCYRLDKLDNRLDKLDKLKPLQNGNKGIQPVHLSSVPLDSTLDKFFSIGAEFDKNLALQGGVR